MVHSIIASSNYGFDQIFDYQEPIWEDEECLPPVRNDFLKEVTQLAQNVPSVDTTNIEEDELDSYQDQSGRIDSSNPFYKSVKPNLVKKKFNWDEFGDKLKPLMLICVMDATS
jgi:hypothetical protein